MAAATRTEAAIRAFSPDLAEETPASPAGRTSSTIAPFFVARANLAGHSTTEAPSAPHILNVGYPTLHLFRRIAKNCPDDVGPVSYTHLDVYKRQVQWIMVGSIIVAAGASMALSLLDSADQILVATAFALSIANTLAPVSYTHLSVATVSFFWVSDI